MHSQPALLLLTEPPAQPQEDVCLYGTDTQLLKEAHNAALPPAMEGHPLALLFHLHLELSVFILA